MNKLQRILKHYNSNKLVFNKDYISIVFGKGFDNTTTTIEGIVVHCANQCDRVKEDLLRGNISSVVHKYASQGILTYKQIALAYKPVVFTERELDTFVSMKENVLIQSQGLTILYGDTITFQGVKYSLQELISLNDSLVEYKRGSLRYGIDYSRIDNQISFEVDGVLTPEKIYGFFSEDSIDQFILDLSEMFYMEEYNVESTKVMLSPKTLQQDDAIKLEYNSFSYSFNSLDELGSWVSAAKEVEDYLVV